MRASLLLCAAVAIATPSPSQDADAAPKVHTVVIANMKFGTVPDGLKAGDVILWVNKDVVKHTATARNRSFHVDLPPGARSQTVVPRPGRYPFYCRYHPAMTGTLVVSK